MFNYRVDKNIYFQGLSPTKIYKGYSNGTKVAIKETMKSKLSTPLHHEFIRNEMAIHFALSNNSHCDNITRAYDYFENDNSYYLVMEFSPNPDFFEDILENVSSY